MAAGLDRRRLLGATVASAVAGAGVYLLVMQWALPSVQTRLTPAQIEGLRQAFMNHPAIVLSAIVAIAAVLGLPVLVVFRWVYGPIGVVPTGKKHPPRPTMCDNSIQRGAGDDDIHST